MSNNWDSDISISDITINGDVSGSKNGKTATNVLFNEVTFKDGATFTNCQFIGCRFTDCTFENTSIGILFDSCDFDSLYTGGTHFSNLFTDVDPLTSAGGPFIYLGTETIGFESCIFNSAEFENITLQYTGFVNCQTNTTEPAGTANGTDNRGITFNSITMDNCLINNFSHSSGTVNPEFVSVSFSNTDIINLHADLGTQVFTSCTFNAPQNDIFYDNPNVTLSLLSCTFNGYDLYSDVLTELLATTTPFFESCTFPANETYSLFDISEQEFNNITFGDGVTWQQCTFKGVIFKAPVFDLSTNNVTFNNSVFRYDTTNKNEFLRGVASDIIYNSNNYKVVFSGCTLNNMSLSSNPNGYGIPTIKNFKFINSGFYSNNNGFDFENFSVLFDNGNYENCEFNNISFSTPYGSNLDEKVIIQNATFTSCTFTNFATADVLKLDICTLKDSTITSNTVAMEFPQCTFEKASGGSSGTSITNNTGSLDIQNAFFYDLDQSASQHTISGNSGGLTMSGSSTINAPSGGVFNYVDFINNTNTGGTSIALNDTVTLTECKFRMTSGTTLNSINFTDASLIDCQIGNENDIELVATINLTDTIFTTVNGNTITNADLSGSTLLRTDFGSTTFSDVKFQDCVITNAHQVLNGMTDEAYLYFPTFQDGEFYAVLKTADNTATLLYPGLSFSGVATTGLNFHYSSDYVNNDNYYIMKTSNVSGNNTPQLGVNTANFDNNTTLDFSNCNFDGYSFANASFRTINLTGANLDNTTFDNTVAISSSININECSISGSTLHPLFGVSPNTRCVNLTYDTTNAPTITGLAEYTVSQDGDIKTIILIGSNSDYTSDTPRFANFNIYDSITGTDNIYLFEDCNFDGCIFDNCNLGTTNNTYESTFNGYSSIIKGINWIGTTFGTASFTNCTFQETMLNQVSLENTTMSSVEFDHCLINISDEGVWDGGTPNGSFTNLNTDGYNGVPSLLDIQNAELPIVANDSTLSVSVTVGVDVPDYRLTSGDDNFYELSFSGSDVGAGTDPIIIDVEGNTFELPHDERCYLYFKINDDSCYINIKTILRGKASYNKYFYIYFQGEELILDIDTYKCYDPNSLSEFELRKAINKFNINKLDLIDINYLENIKINFSNDDVLRITLGENKHFLKFWRKNSSIKMINGNYNQEKNGGLILGKAHGKIMESLTSFIETNENVF